MPTPRSLMVMRYSPSAGKVVFEPYAAARAQRQRHVRVLIGGDGVLRIRNTGIGIADRELRHLPGGGDVLAQEGGRHGQRSRNVVEAVDLDVLRQDVRRFQVHTHQRLHRRGVLRAVQTLDRNMARLRSFGMGVERVLHPADERIDILLRQAADCRAAASNVRAACAAPSPRSPRYPLRLGGPGRPTRGRRSSRGCCGSRCSRCSTSRDVDCGSAAADAFPAVCPAALVCKSAGEAIKTRTALA